jgi:hypothetical protein
MNRIIKIKSLSGTIIRYYGCNVSNNNTLNQYNHIGPNAWTTPDDILLVKMERDKLSDIINTYYKYYGTKNEHTEHIKYSENNIKKETLIINSIKR